MTEQYPITPPPKLIRQWNEEAATAPMADQRYIAIQAARWGADTELEACCEWIHDWYGRGSDEVVTNLRTARRPKPLSPKEEALQVLESLIESRRIVDPEYQALRHALEQLND